LLCTATNVIIIRRIQGKFTGWGWEDQDLLIRATFLALRYARRECNSLSHSDAARNQHHQQLPPTQTRDCNIISAAISPKGDIFGDLRQPAMLPHPLLEIPPILPKF
jgi:hypothetical protein